MVRCYITAYNSLMEYFKDLTAKEIGDNGRSNFVRAYSSRWHEFVDFFDSLSYKVFQDYSMRFPHTSRFLDFFYLDHLPLTGYFN